MVEQRFAYEGPVRLVCQEGGFAHAAIELVDLPDGTPQDVTTKVRSMLGHEPGKKLDEILFEIFEAIGEPNSYGDIEIGDLKIIVERI